MNQETLEQEWQQLEDRISQYVDRLLNEDSSIENRPDSISQADYKNEDFPDI